MGRHDSGLVYEVCRMYFEQDLSVTQIAQELLTRFPQHFSNRGDDKLREQIYPILRDGFKRRLVLLSPPLNDNISEQLRTCLYKLGIDLGTRQIRVVETDHEIGADRVPLTAAKWALELINDINEARNRLGPVSVGLGPGRATYEFARHLGTLLNTSPDTPSLELTAISAGCIASQPEYAPTNFFTFFPSDLVAGRTGMFGANLIRAKQYREVIRMPGLSEAFDKKKNIDVCITAMGHFKDPHDLYRQWLDDLRAVPTWRHTNCIPADAIGNVQYRPFSETGPINERPGQPRAITLFELSDFVEMSRMAGKYVILMVRQCHLCKVQGLASSRAPAVLPLLTVPELLVWNRLVIDRTTAQELLNMLLARS